MIWLAPRTFQGFQIQLPGDRTADQSLDFSFDFLLEALLEVFFDPFWGPVPPLSSNGPGKAVR